MCRTTLAARGAHGVLADETLGRKIRGRSAILKRNFQIVQTPGTHAGHCYKAWLLIDGLITLVIYVNSNGVHDENGMGEPHVGMEFDSEDAAKTFYDEYARREGFSSKVGPSSQSKLGGVIVAREFVCARDGLKRKSVDSCSAMIRIELKGQFKWVLTKFVKEHNHAMVSPSKVHHLRPRRHFAGATKNMADNIRGATVVPSGVMYVSMDDQGIDSAFFDGYVNQQTTLPMFFRQYERAFENWFEKEIEADFDTICTSPVLRTPSPMEKQAANLYTRKVFAKFQEELVETFVYTANRIEGDGITSTFRVAKFEEDSKAYIVTLNHSDMRANCSCRMFEYSGILCRHVLTVFTVSNVLTLPSHYIMKRWTRNAKTCLGLDDCVSELQGHESLTVRYNNLCREALKYAEEGAIASETYNAAMNALKEGGRKISTGKKNVARVPPPASQIGGAGYDDHKSTSSSDMTPLLWPRQDEVTRRFNLNDASAPAQNVSDLNLPRMGPLFLHRDDVHAENTAVLPCLKSMTWAMENKNSTPENRVAVINLKLQDYSRSSSTEAEVKFQLSRVTLEPMLRSMAYISEQLSTPDNRVAVINLKLQDTETTSGESEVKFQVSRDTLGAMLRSMAYIREQLSSDVEPQSDPPVKKQRK
ncbi:hypothetical protein NL676_031307 [Syzygium grande]|nr:hypothetical protein NL676_031307 [Syzygium grande]